MKEKKEEINMKYMRDIINQLIKDDKIKFDFYNSNIPLELLQICYNEKDNTVELSFRDIQQYHIDELRELNKQNSIK